MKFSVDTTPLFRKQFKKLAKKYKNIKNDYIKLISILEEEPNKKGIDLGNSLFKIRLKNSDNNRCKSSGYRVIYYVITDELEVSLLTIYSKNELENINEFELKNLLQEAFKEK